MSGSDIPASARLSGAAQRAAEKGDHITARELSAAACTAYEQECETVHNKALAQANTPLREVWGGRSQEGERER